MVIQAQQYWDTVGFKKDFEDPLYLNKLSPFLKSDSNIVEYGCGYGRLMRILKDHNYHNLIGFDYSQSIIKRGKTANPDLDLRLLEKPNKVPCPDESVDAILMSTVLCCMIDIHDQTQLINELFRILKKGGILYLSDFLICDDERYKAKYAEGFRNFGNVGIYTTSENLTVRHLTTQIVFDLLKNFDIQWFEQFDF